MSCEEPQMPPLSPRGLSSAALSVMRASRGQNYLTSSRTGDNQRHSLPFFLRWRFRFLNMSEALQQPNNRIRSLQ